jgi:hypothetical protein
VRRTTQVGALELRLAQGRGPEVRGCEPRVPQSSPIEPGTPEVGPDQVNIPQFRVDEHDGAPGGLLQVRPLQARRRPVGLPADPHRVQEARCHRLHRRIGAGEIPPELLFRPRPSGDPRRGLADEIARERSGQGTALGATREVVCDPVRGQQELDRPMADQAEERLVRLMTAEALDAAGRAEPGKDEGGQAIAFDELAELPAAQAPVELDPERVSRAVDRPVRRHLIERDPPELGDALEKVDLGSPPREAVHHRGAEAAVSGQQILDPLVAAPGCERELG